MSDTIFELKYDGGGKIVAVQFRESLMPITTGLPFADVSLTPIVLLDLVKTVLLVNAPGGSTNAVYDRLNDAIGILNAEHERELYLLQNQNKD